MRGRRRARVERKGRRAERSTTRVRRRMEWVTVAQTTDYQDGPFGPVWLGRSMRIQQRVERLP